MTDWKFVFKQATIFGAIAGIVVSSIFYYLDPSPRHLLFIPLGALMGWGYSYTERGKKGRNR